MPCIRAFAQQPGLASTPAKPLYGVLYLALLLLLVLLLLLLLVLLLLLLLTLLLLLLLPRTLTSCGRRSSATPASGRCSSSAT